MAKLSTKEYIKALEKMKKSPKDRIGTLGEMGALFIGAGGGVAAAGTIAGYAGATTLLGSSTLGSLLGGIFVTATPVGWVVGSAVAAGVLAYGAAKLVRSGGKSDAIKEMNQSELKKIIANKKRESDKASIDENKYKKLIEALQLLIVNKRITQQKSNELLIQIQKQHISVDFAFETIKNMSK